ARFPCLKEEQMRTVCVSLVLVVAVLTSDGVGGAQPPHAIKLFSATPVNESACSLGCNPGSDRVVFDEASLLLSCRPHSTAVLSSTADGLGPLVADNFIEVNGRNVCTGGTNTGDSVEQCSNWQGVPQTGTRPLEADHPATPPNVRRFRRSARAVWKPTTQCHRSMSVAICLKDEGL